jgi:hypothetical protein
MFGRGGLAGVFKRGVWGVFWLFCLVFKIFDGLYILSSVKVAVCILDRGCILLKNVVFFGSFGLIMC